jgi:outer membrane protein assembly factor BamB
MAIVGDKLYTLGTDLGEKNEVVLCLDAAKGTKLWTATIGPTFTFEGNIWGDGPRGTPTIDGSHLYAIGGQGILVCLDIAGAQPKELWRKDLIKDLGGVGMNSAGNWGYCESPLVDGKLLICSPGGAKGTVAALDKMTGEVIWRTTELKHEAAYTSAIIADINGVRQYIQASFAGDKEGGYLSGIAAKDGKVLWSEKTVPGAIYNIAPAPIVKGNFVYQTTYAGGCHLFEIAKNMKPKEQYSKENQKTLTNNHGGVVLVGDHVYGYGKEDWICQDFKTGDEVWIGDKVQGHKSACLTSADGMLYLYTDRGEVGLAAADPADFKLAGQFKLPERSRYIKGPASRSSSQSAGAWAYPVIANGHLYLRDGELIFCYDVRK